MAHFEKEYIVKEVSDSFKNAEGLIVSNFEKISAVEIDSLRRKLEKNSAELIVTKNTLLKRALTLVDLSDVSQFLDGITGITVYHDDPVSAAKTLYDFSKDHATFKVRGGVIEGTLLNDQKTKELSELPSKDVLRATVVMRMKSPITGLVNVLAGSIRGFVTVLQKISDQKAEKTE